MINTNGEKETDEEKGINLSILSRSVCCFLSHRREKKDKYILRERNIEENTDLSPSLSVEKIKNKNKDKEIKILISLSLSLLVSLSSYLHN